MISKMAMGDIEAMTAEGLKISPRDIVRLNALGLRVERASRAAEFVAVPRLAFLGDISFREPTIGDEEWLAVAGQSYNLDDPETETLVVAACLSTRCADLPDPRDVPAVGRLLKRFRKGPVRRYTRAQLAAALEYALYGNDATAGESAPPQEAKPRESEDEREPMPQWAGVLRDGVALKLGTLTELKQLTTSQLYALVQYSIECKHGGKLGDAAKSTPLGDYMRTLESIRNAATEGRSNG